jgi:L-glyceraldehyde 3-phosphate reductase
MHPYLASETRYDGSMQYRRSGRSGLLLPVISLGLWHNFGGVDTLENGRAMVRRAFDLGITHFDLANNYGPPPGSAEENFGRLLATDLKPYRDELIISSKAGYLMWPGPYGEWGSRKYLVASCDQSLKRMGLDYVDIFYSHRPDPNTPLEETMAALEYIVKSGRALYAGISSYGGDLTRESAKLLAERGIKLLIHQPVYNMLNRWVEPDLWPALDEHGVGMIAFCPLAQGLLTNKYLHGIPEDSRAAKPTGALRSEQVSEETLRKIRALAPIAEARGQSIAQLALAWTLRNPLVTSALIGASRVSQVEENVKTLGNLSLTDAELQQIEAALG